MIRVADQSDLLDRLVELASTTKGQRLLHQLSQIKGVSLKNGHEGRLTIGKHDAQLRLETEHLLVVRHDVKQPPAPGAALVLNSGLPLNLRLARHHHGMVLLADVPVEGDVLEKAIRDVRRGIRQALGGDASAGESPQREDVARAIGEMCWPQDDIVELGEDGWELRPRFHGRPTPVRLTMDERGIRLFTVIVSGFEGGLAIASQAVRLNSQLRWARLAADEQTITAESRWPASAIRGDRIDLLARAVAVASRHAAPSLEILHREPDVADMYIAMCETSHAPTAAS